MEKKMIAKILLGLLMTSTLNPPLMAHDHKDHNHSTPKEAPAPSIKLAVLKITDKDSKKIVQIKLTKIKDNSPVSLEALKEIHTQKIHLLINNDRLQDYSHVHPQETKEPGVYEFEWEPKNADDNYRIWADLHPVETNTQEYAITDLTTTKAPKTKIDKQISMESTLNGLTFKLSFDSPTLKSKQSSMGKIDITDDKGNPVKDLQPLMGAYAHIVAFGDDFKSILHIHPMGDEPTKEKDRGGPTLEFHIDPEKTGFIKLYAQIKIKDKEIFAPFGVIVK